jgi:hypothetical protein
LHDVSTADGAHLHQAVGINQILENTFGENLEANTANLPQTQSKISSTSHIS